MRVISYLLTPLKPVEERENERKQGQAQVMKFDKELLRI
jgi:hypothetical protein